MIEKGSKRIPQLSLCEHVSAQYVHMFAFVRKTLYAATKAIKASVWALAGGHLFVKCFYSATNPRQFDVMQMSIKKWLLYISQRLIEMT